MTDDYDNHLSQIKIDTEKDEYQDTAHSRKSRINIVKPKWFKVPDQMPLGLIGIVLFALIILFILFFPKSGKDKTNGYLAEVEQRLLLLEEKTAILASAQMSSPSLSEGFEERVQKLEQRMEILEGSLSLRMKQLEKKLKVLRTSSVTRTSKKTSAQKRTDKTIPKKKSGIYHTVKAGDTVYSIGLKYGLKPDEVRRLNKLGKDAKIFPGQKLHVSK